jgi:phosphatidylinositol glycan class U
MPKLKIESGQSPISPSTVAALYLFNPLTLLSCASKSTIIFTNLSIVLALLSISKGNKDADKIPWFLIFWHTKKVKQRFPCFG